MARLPDRAGEARPVNRWWYLVLLVPFVAVLWVPFYSSGTPVVLGFPFFYWYQFLWILISALLTGLVYFVTREREGEPANGNGAGSPVEDYH
ncbi:MAG: DUF3311 domain-containing protein [Chloroflexi bacterium]|nr:DUF3311 domain-containing protein [Solirubrobacterales bacterium]MBV9323549.1 DUF3311 domain-containing protein [Chloroflexota bacterium]MBV9602752.1 DUF3311 domain-containing protein [Chloroflexota bacterium]